MYIQEFGTVFEVVRVSNVVVYFGSKGRCRSNVTMGFGSWASGADGARVSEEVGVSEDGAFGSGSVKFQKKVEIHNA